MKTMLWKFYFWVILALDMIAFVMPQQRRVWETVDMGVFLLALFGLFGFCWSKQMLSRLFWRISLVCLLAWIGWYAFVLAPVPAVASQAAGMKLPSRLLTGLAIVPHIPLVVALYLYAFRSAEVWD
jgi:hypothetical protein